MAVVSRRDNIIGWIGALSIVVAYALLTFEVVGAQELLYNILNLIGGICLGYRVWIDRNYSNLFLEIVFIGVACYALMKIVM